jgi:hypothetical protein
LRAIAAGLAQKVPADGDLVDFRITDAAGCDRPVEEFDQDELTVTGTVDGTTHKVSFVIDDWDIDLDASVGPNRQGVWVKEADGDQFPYRLVRPPTAWCAPVHTHLTRRSPAHSRRCSRPPTTPCSTTCAPPARCASSWPPPSARSCRGRCARPPLSRSASSSTARARRSWRCAAVPL